MFFKHKWHIVYFLPMFTEAIYRNSTDKQGLIVTSTSSLVTHGNVLQHIQSDEQITDKAMIKNWTSFEGKTSNLYSMFAFVFYHKPMILAILITKNDNKEINTNK